jgi:hypothetical protein
MSGFEVAGLVLAVIPLVVEGLNSYPVQTVAKRSAAFVKTKRELQEFAQELRELRRELRSALIDIIMSIKPALNLSPEERLALTARNSGGSKFFEVWNQILKTNSALIENALEHTIEDIKEVIEHMQRALVEMLQYHQIPPDSGADILKEIIRSDRDKTFPIKHSLTQRLNFAMSQPRRRALLREIRDDVDCLQRLHREQEQITRLLKTTANLSTKESRGSRSPVLDTVRDPSCILYDTISKVWKCDCHKPISVMLRLERRETLVEEWGTLPFCLIFTFQHSAGSHKESQETEILVNQMYDPLIYQTYPEANREEGPIQDR